MPLPPGVAGPSALAFARLARCLTAAARARGLGEVAFRSPPRLPGVDRSLLRCPGITVVAVRRRGRPGPEVLDDMVEGVVAAAGLSGAEAEAQRHALRSSVAGAPARSAA